ncbi:MAG: UDP-N-acetylmuramoyl-L-alanine--D-glutamate ligase [Rikenellaceae bacterium]
MKNIVILGGGVSGYGSAILAAKKGYKVFLSDMGKIRGCDFARFEELGIEWEEGEHTQQRILSADEVIKSPGIPDTAPIIVALHQAGVSVVSEIEFAGRYLNGAKTICITGSNGKSTTTMLIYKILCDAGYSVALGGNIGESFALSVADGEYDWYVLEISSFQLDGMFDFRADVALLLNVTPDHLDRYEYSFEKYTDSKMRVIQNQTSEDSFIYFEDEGVVSQRAAKIDSCQIKLPFSLNQKSVQGASLEGGMIVAQRCTERIEIDPSKMLIKGRHNVYNAMAATLAALAAGVKSEVIKESVYSFTSIEHRMEEIAEIDGALYVNDSKATNVDSVFYALDAMTRPVVWIAGGTDKGNDYSSLMPVIKDRVHTLICMGLDNSKLVKVFSGVIPNVVSCSDFDSAAQAATAAANPGDVVLLSPACASFDLFRNYMHRGDLFREYVEKLKK